MIRYYTDAQIVCSVHPGQKYCEHKVIWAEALGAKLTELRALRRKKLQERKRVFAKKPEVTKRRIPVPLTFRYVWLKVV